MTNVNKIIEYMRLTNDLEFKANYYLRNYIHIQSLKRPILDPGNTFSTIQAIEK
jgi:hypothetical protein